MKMEAFPLGFLLNYITLGVALVAFVTLLVIFLLKRKSLSKPQKVSLLIVLAIIILYLFFIAIVVIGFGAQTPEPPAPMPIP